MRLWYVLICCDNKFDLNLIIMTCWVLSYKMKNWIIVFSFALVSSTHMCDSLEFNGMVMALWEGVMVIFWIVYNKIDRIGECES